MSSHASRPFSTTTQVYPAYLPTLHKTGRMEKKLATAAVAAVGIGYGLARYKQTQAQSQSQSQQSEQQKQKQEKRSEAMMNAYGDRSSLAELEAAVQAYDSQTQTRQPQKQRR
ncbi:hypothetical protein F4809DRAFT_156726 [Biscogniauxia mediterranea]|nr:hypothetical protein F4809DRAFT_156726 [Biscogniauxia mediterranea]